MPTAQHVTGQKWLDEKIARGVEKLHEYRCTRPDAYPPGSLGEKDLSARQGYYRFAEDEAEAHREMRSQFPRDSHFDVELWNADAWCLKESCDGFCMCSRHAT